MSSAVSRRGRRILGHLGPEADLLGELASTCVEHEVGVGTVRGVGRLRAAALRPLGPSDEVVELTGPLELLSLEGRVDADHARGRLRAVILCDRGTGSEVVGGVVERATAEDVDYTIDSCDDVALPRPAAVPEVVAVPEAVAQAAPSWADVAAASAAAAAAQEAAAEAPADEADEPEVRIMPGDVIEHPRFKRCTVYKVEGDQDFVQVALRNGRIVRLSLEVLELRPAGVEGGQRVFRALIV